MLYERESLEFEDSNVAEEFVIVKRIHTYKSGMKEIICGREGSAKDRLLVFICPSKPEGGMRDMSYGHSLPVGDSKSTKETSQKLIQTTDLLFSLEDAQSHIHLFDIKTGEVFFQAARIK
jgi:hypothetical protein